MQAKNLELIQHLIKDHPQVYYSHMLLAIDPYLVPVGEIFKMDDNNFVEVLKTLYQGIIPFEDLVLTVWRDEEANIKGSAAMPFISLEKAIIQAMKSGHRSMYVQDVRVKIPGVQTAGTNYQKNAYIQQTAEKLAKEFGNLV